MEARRSLLVEEKRDRRRGEVEDELRAPERPPALARLRPFELVEELSPGGERPARVREGERESDRQRERERERERERKRKRKREIERERERERERARVTSLDKAAFAPRQCLTREGRPATPQM